MGIVLDLGDAQQRELFVRFAPWSIHAVASSRDGRELAGVHDSGHLFWVELPPEQEDWFRAVADNAGVPKEALERY